ncbi:MAG: DUF4402 domain-containing protein [Desulfobacteraceae bacterium]
MKFKKTYLTAACFLSLVFFGSNQCFAATTQTLSLNATATIEAASLNASIQNDLNFGTIIVSNQQSEVTIDASAGSATPVVTSGSASVTGGGSGLIHVTTNLDSNITITYPPSVTITDTGGVNTMTINSIAVNSTPSPLNAVSGTPNELHVGGMLTVDSLQTADTYTGTVSITVSY